MSQRHGILSFTPKLPTEKPSPGPFPPHYRELPVAVANQPILLPDDMYWNHRTKKWMITHFAGHPAHLTDQYARKKTIKSTS